MKRKLVFLFIAVVVFPLALAIFSTTQLVSGQLDLLLQKRARDGLEVAQNLFRNLLDEMGLKVRILAQSKDIRDAAMTGDLVELIDRVNLSSSHLKLSTYDAIVEVYDAGGKLLIGEPCTRLPLCPESLVRETLAGRLLSIRDLVDGRLRLCSTAPLYHEGTSTPVGAVVLTVFSSDLIADEIRRIVGTDIVFFGFTEGHSLLFGSTFRENGKPLPLTFTPIEAAGMGFERRVAGRGFLFQVAPFEVQSGTVFIGTAVDQTLLAEVAGMVGSNLLFIGVFALLFALVLALLFSRTLTRPIGELVQGAQALGSGNLDRAVLIESDDEFSFLGSTFDGMRIRIRDTIGQLKEAKRQVERQVFDLSLRNMINQAIIYQKEGDLLAGILEILREIMEVRVAALFVADPSGDLFLKAISAKAGEVAETGAGLAPASGGLPLAGFSPRRGFAGRAAFEAKTLICNDLSAIPPEDTSWEPAWAMKGNNLMACPLSGENGILGVVYLVDRPQGFDLGDVELLTSISCQVAIAFQKAQLHQLAITDGLTGLFIHRYFQIRLEAEIVKARRQQQPVSLILFDVDHFKKFNDTWGHQVGDRVLKRVAEITRTTVRGGVDLPARYGGEEFAVVMPDTPIEGALLLAERLRAAVEADILAHGDHQIRVTISLGFAAFPDQADSREVLIRRADEALYQSKRDGRNRVTDARRLIPGAAG